MDKCLYRGIDIFNPIEKNIKYYIDAFAKVYGEKYRPVIERRLKQAHYYFLGGNFDTAIEVYRLKEKEELDNLKRYNISPSLTKLKEKEIHDRYQTIINVFLKSKQKAEDINSRYSVALNDFLARRINVIRNNKGLPDINSRDNQVLGAIFYNILRLGKTNLIQYSDRLLTEAHKNQYTMLFSSLGYNEKNFESYLKNRQLLSEVFDSTVIRILHALNNEKAKELDKINFCVTDLNHELEKLNIHGGCSVYAQAGSEFIQNKSGTSAFVINCLTMNSEFKSLCFCKNALELSLEDLVHEMGHIIDAFVIESNKNIFYYKSGYELHYYLLNSQGAHECNIPRYGEKGYRKNEMFNEMVNEFVALKVYEELKKNDKQFVFGSRSKDYIIKYAYGFEIFKDFLNKHYKKLIEFKMGADRNQPAYAYFGEKNLEKLTEIAREYIETREELNRKLFLGDKHAKKQIERLFVKCKAKVAFIEKAIDKRLEKTAQFAKLSNTSILTSFYQPSDEKEVINKKTTTCKTSDETTFAQAQNEMSA